MEKDNKTGPWITYTTKGLEFDFSELDNKVQYKFEVIAKNKGGESLPGERYIQTSYPESMYFLKTSEILSVQSIYSTESNFAKVALKLSFLVEIRKFPLALSVTVSEIARPKFY